ncbi:hypothetical protein ACU3L3_07415 [Priestia endophytica]
MIKGKCAYCKKDFTGTQSKKKYCSPSCKTMFLRKKNNPKQLLNRNCSKCGKSYKGTASSKYCSEECGYVQKECLYCKIIFKGHFNSKFCSPRCKDAYKIRKSTGEFKTCLVCEKSYEITYGKKKTQKQVCSVKCANILASSKSGKYVTLEQIEDVVRTMKNQPSAKNVADYLNTSHTTVLTRAKEKYGSYRQMVENIRGVYDVMEQDKSFTANTLFNLIDRIYKVKGTREKVFSDLTNPVTGAHLRLDYYLKDIPLGIEYHGQQHYKQVEFFDKGDPLKLEERKIRDALKEAYLQQNNIPLVVFSYKDILSEDLIKERLNCYFK